MDAVILAGGIPRPDEPLYAYSNGEAKALIDVAGKPMIQWVYERTSKNEIPHMKVGKYLRFKQQTIKHWAGGMSVPDVNQPCGIIPGLQIGSNRLRRRRITSRGRATGENPSPGSINPEGGR